MLGLSAPRTTAGETHLGGEVRAKLVATAWSRSYDGATTQPLQPPRKRGTLAP